MKIELKTIIAIPLFVVLALNTRIPSLVYDICHSKTGPTISKKLQLSVGDPIRLDSNTNKIEFRVRPYDFASPDCDHAFFFCHLITGFSPPYTGIGFYYNTEEPAQSLRSFGYALAGSGQIAPTLQIRAKEEENHLVINQILIDATGKQVASEFKKYRNSFPLESFDMSDGRTERRDYLWFLEYMLHGNVISWWVGNVMGYSVSSPVGKFLNKATERYVQQDDPRFTQLQEPIVDSDVKMNPPKDYLASDDAWTEEFYDKTRSKACKAVIEPAVTNIDVPDFTVGDEMRRQRRPYKFINGRLGTERILLHSIVIDETLCDGEFLYQVSMANNYRQYIISKYKYDGSFVYRVAFEKPRSAPRLLSSIAKPSLREEKGQLIFKYVDFTNSASSRSIYRIRKMRLRPSQIQQ
jgi:hypothetical protein